MLPRRNVLIFHAGALGDFVLTWPLALALARLYPQSRVYYVTSAGKGKLAERALRVDASDLDTAGWHHLFAENAALPPQPEKLLTSAHTIVTFLSDGQDGWAANVARIAGAEATLVPLIAPTRATLPQPGFENEHAADFILRQLTPWPVLAESTRQILRSINERGVASRPAADGGVVIHPGSGGADKCWPIERYADLAARLTGGGRRVTFTVGEVELDRWPAEQLARLESIAPLARQTELIDLLALLRSADRFVGNDSGPAHLAGILGVPTVVLFGPTSAGIWKPLGPSVEVIQGATLTDITVEDVLGRV